MIKREDLTRELVVTSLYSRTCPACGERKGAEKSLCWGCWCKLPRAFQGPLYQRVGQGYEPALHEALLYLKAEKFHTEESL